MAGVWLVRGDTPCAKFPFPPLETFWKSTLIKCPSTKHTDAICCVFSISAVFKNRAEERELKTGGRLTMFSRNTIPQRRPGTNRLAFAITVCFYFREKPTETQARGVFRAQGVLNVVELR